MGRFNDRTGGLVAFACGLVLALVAPAGATTVEPRGAAFTAVNMGAVTFTTGMLAVNCNNAATNGVIPGAPDNPNLGINTSVIGTIAAPAMTNCVANGLIPVEVLTNASNGQWTESFTYFGASLTVGTMAVPRGGIVIQGPPELCKLTAPFGVVAPLAGIWHAETHTLVYTSQQAPISWTGTSCPRETAGNWSGTFVVTSTGGPVTVGP